MKISPIENSTATQNVQFEKDGSIDLSKTHPKMVLDVQCLHPKWRYWGNYKKFFGGGVIQECEKCGIFRKMEC